MKRRIVADSHAGLLHRVRPLNTLHPRQYGEQVKAAAEYAIAEDRTLVVLGVESTSGAPVWCEWCCEPCLHSPGAVLVVPDLVELRAFAHGVTLTATLPGRSWVRYTRPDQRTARIIAI